MADKKTTIPIHLQPNAKRDEIADLRDGVLWVRVKAPPLKGQANKAMLVFMAQALKVPQDALTIIRGYTSRTKLLAIRGLSPEDLEERLAQSLPGKQVSQR